jgi:hypothetical protein
LWEERTAMEFSKNQTTYEAGTKLVERSGKSTSAIETSDDLVEYLLREREPLSKCNKAMRLWIYAVIDGNMNLNRQSREMMLFQAIENLPDYLLEVLLADE